MNAQDAVGQLLMRGIRLIERKQLGTGEIPTYYHFGHDRLEYRFSLLISTFVYDALGCFDPGSLWLLPHSLELIPDPYRPWFVQTAARIRRRIRAFLQWQEEAEGLWRFFGRGSRLAPDANTTACAAAILQEGRRPVATSGRPRHVEALRRFRSAGGSYYTWIDPGGQGYSWIDERGGLIPGHDRVVNANVLRFLALAGEETAGLLAFVLREATDGDLASGCAYCPEPLSFYFVVTRAWHQAGLDSLAELGAALVPRILDRVCDDGGFGDPLCTALALSALLNLEQHGETMDRARASLFTGPEVWSGWDHHDLFSDGTGGYGSPALTTALVMNVLARMGEGA